MKTMSLPLSPTHEKALLFALATGTFMSALDASVVNLALPVVQKTFGVSLSTVEWVITAYLLLVSILLLPLGRWSDTLGQKKIYVGGFALFTLSSGLCGLSSSIFMLIAFRILQALGASMMFSTSSAIITAHYPESKRGQAFGFIAIAVASACCIGPVLGGFLVHLYGWQSIFWINLPIGLIGVSSASSSIPNLQSTPPSPFDRLGSLLFVMGLLCCLLPVQLSNRSELNPLALAFIMFLGLCILFFFISHERKTLHPLLPMSLFKNKIFTASLLAALGNYTAQFIMAFLLPFFLQKIMLMTPTRTGLTYLSMPLFTILAAPLSGRYSDRHDSRILSSSGMALMSLGLVTLSWANAKAPVVVMIISLALIGAGSGMFQAPNNSTLMGNVDSKYRGAASGLLATVRNLGMMLGVALSGTLFHFFTYYDSNPGQTLFIQGFHLTLLVAAAVAGLAMVASLMKGPEHKTFQNAVETKY